MLFNWRWHSLWDAVERGRHRLPRLHSVPARHRQVNGVLPVVHLLLLLSGEKIATFDEGRIEGFRPGEFVHKLAMGSRPLTEAS